MHRNSASAGTYSATSTSSHARLMVLATVAAEELQAQECSSANDITEKAKGPCYKKSTKMMSRTRPKPSAMAQTMEFKMQQIRRKNAKHKKFLMQNLSKLTLNKGIFTERVATLGRQFGECFNIIHINDEKENLYLNAWYVP